MTVASELPSLREKIRLHRHSRFGLVWLAVFLGLAVGSAFYIPNRPASEIAPTDFTAESTVAVAAPPRVAAARMKPIQDYRVGDRIIATNPLGGEEEPEPDPATWKSVDLRMRKQSGKYVTMTLLLSPETMEELGVVRSSTIELDLPEMAVSGPANVLSVNPCPRIEPGEGCVVTGTFAHESEGNLVNLFIGGIDEPIGVTESHPFFSEDRSDFVASGELRPGERLSDLRIEGGARVLRVERRFGDELVYNLQVNSEHVYHVGPNAILVHNVCAGWNHMIPRALGSKVSYGAKAVLKWMDEAEHTEVHKLLYAHLDGYTKTVRGKTISMNPLRSSGREVRAAFKPKERLQALEDFYKKNPRWWSDYEKELEFTLQKGKGRFK